MALLTTFPGCAPKLRDTATTSGDRNLLRRPKEVWHATPNSARNSRKPPTVRTQLPLYCTSPSAMQPPQTLLRTFCTIIHQNCRLYFLLLARSEGRLRTAAPSPLQELIAQAYDQLHPLLLRSLFQRQCRHHQNTGLPAPPSVLQGLLVSLSSNSAAGHSPQPWEHLPSVSFLLSPLLVRRVFQLLEPEASLSSTSRLLPFL